MPLDYDTHPRADIAEFPLDWMRVERGCGSAKCSPRRAGELEKGGRPHTAGNQLTGPFAPETLLV